MALRIRFQYESGLSLGYSIERLADGLFYDFSTSSFASTPATLVASLPEGVGAFQGSYRTALTSTPPAQFSNGDFGVTIHNMAASNLVVGELAVAMYNGDDATVFPSSSGIDPWMATVPGTYPAGSAGAILGGNLDVPVSSRSTFAGGVVAGVTAPVTVGINADKNGYSLAAGGLDSIAVETGVNARQALSPILAASAGVLLGAGTGSITIKGGNVTTTRVTATTDDSGNRLAVTLNLPS